MKIIINGETRETSAKTLANLLADLDYEGEWLATAVNGELVQSATRTKYRLADGDRIEILSPMQGG
ncbi:sulfur carrier protein ThiS [Rhizobium sp. L1K21]|uniref:sulfur carrier protein ThiS n=1 Tax=Rhizobium sp. L1K21 TaxID=2954933 RepID=UPI002092DB8D|nr:sulfur carrier protein ThiS [Rhizobium sp. L1K21]MCO6188545.1 sulfur carrier protein ThiS [Rhizobium sp. L1K21]